VGIVVLKRLDDALIDGDTVYAIVLGSALNNDGSSKVGFTAPSPKGQTGVICDALNVAGITPQEISYVEAHGSGTQLGDMVEIDALNRAFQRHTDRRAFCALGSVKTNIGHLDAAAGIAGLIKTVMALHRREIPPHLHFTQSSLAIDFSTGPFFIVRERQPWPKQDTPRRAGVSSFGIGGTNVHLLLEEAPRQTKAATNRHWHVLPLSARSESSLSTIMARLADYLTTNDAVELADVARTLQLGRHEFPYRRAVICSGPRQAAEELRRAFAGDCVTDVNRAKTPERGVLFLFPDQDPALIEQGKQLYTHETTFRREVDSFSPILQQLFSLDASVLLDREKATCRLGGGALANCLTFVLEYALARVWMHWGVTPAGMWGCGVGEFVAACLSGVLSLDQGLFVVAERGTIIQGFPEGAMLTVDIPVECLKAIIRDPCGLVAASGPGSSLLMGAAEIITKVTQSFPKSLRVQTMRFLPYLDAPLSTRHRVSLSRVMQRVQLKRPRIPLVSNASGNWIRDDEATDPSYWLPRVANAEELGSIMRTIASLGDVVCLEIGAGQTLIRLIRAYLLSESKGPSGSFPIVEGYRDKVLQLAHTLAAIWQRGVKIDWGKLYENEKRIRIALPTYPFERQQFWVDYRPSSNQGHRPFKDVESQENQPCNAKADVSSAQVPINTGLMAPATCHITPTLELESKVTAMWREVLQVSDIGPNDNFFALNGDSLIATQILARIRQSFGATMTLQDLFACPTVRLLSERLMARRESAVAVDIAITSSNERHEPSFAQQRLWFLDQLMPSNPAYSITFAICAQGPLHVGLLEQSLRAILERHEVLRTTFHAIEGRPQLHVASRIELELPTENLEVIPEKERKDALRQIIMEHSNRPFDLQTGPLLRATLVREGRARHVLILSVHHIAFDVWSAAVFFRELAALYEGYSTGAPSSLKRVPIQYADFAAWQRRWISGPALENLLRVWLARLQGERPRLILPPDLKAPTRRSWAGSEEIRHLEPALSQRLRLYCAERGFTPFMVLLAAYNTLLHQRTSVTDLWVGTDVANRNRLETEGLIGFFVNQLVVRTQIAEADRFVAFLEQVRSVSLEAFSNQDMPYDKLVEVLRPRRGSRPTELFDAKFVMRNVRLPAIHVRGVALELLELERNATAFDLALTAAEMDGRFRLGVEYSTELYRRETMIQVLADYERILRLALEQPTIFVGHMCEML
jgi:acyl carrier protein